MASGPLSGLKVIEFAGIGPGPFCGMLLSDMGADVIRIDRKADHNGGMGLTGTKFAVTERGRRSIAMDLKRPEAVETCLRLFEHADAIFEGFRPGVMERLGLGPEPALARNDRLIYGRITGWGQTGPYANAAGHDLNYIAISGALACIGTDKSPVPPLNLVGDFGGGALYLAFGLLAGILQARATGRGQVVDCAMSDGAASLMALFYGMKARGLWKDGRGANLFDGGAHFYNSYCCADGKWITVASLEPQFYAELLDRLRAADPEFQRQMDSAGWPVLRDKMQKVFVKKTRDEWCTLLEGTDVCFAPVLGLDEAPLHPHNRARETFVELEGVIQPAPAPRFSITPGEIQGPPPQVGVNGDEILAEWGFSDAERAALSAAGVI